jgi:hypothetical protein
MENCCACLTGYLLLLCMPTHYEKVIIIIRFFFILIKIKIFSVLNVLQNILQKKMKMFLIIVAFLCLIQWKKDFDV